VSASSFFCVVIILYFFIFLFKKLHKTENPANEVRRVCYLGLQLINYQFKNLAGCQN